MKNVHILPTDKPSRLHKYNFEGFALSKETLNWKEAYNIYITSDEEIKEGDWYLDTTVGVIFKSHKIVLNGVGYRKIILSTDQDLIAEGIQQIDDEFLEWFVKNPSCEEVEIDHERVLWETGEITHYKYKIIIPKEEVCSFCDGTGQVVSSTTISRFKTCDCKIISKEEPKQDRTCTHNCSVVCGECQIFEPKQESLEEIVSKQFQKDFNDEVGNVLVQQLEKQEIKLEEVFNDEKKENIKKFIDEINNPSQPNDKLKQAFEKYSEYLEDYENKNTYEHGFKDGAKWQQEISYSEEEVIAFGEFIFKHSLLTHTRGVKSLFEQFKKK